MVDREAWAREIYANFDIDDCIEVEERHRESALDTDPAFARYLSASVARRRSRRDGLRDWPPYADLLEFGTDVEASPESDEDLLLAAAALRAVACGALYVSDWNARMGVAVSDTATTKRRLLERARRMADGAPSTTEWVHREVAASLGTAEIKEAGPQVSSLEAFDRLSRHAAEWPDYTPAFFDRAHQARVCHAQSPTSFERARVTQCFHDAVDAASGWMAPPGDDGVRLIARTGRSRRSSGVELAERQLALVASDDPDAASQLESLERDRFAAARVV